MSDRTAVRADRTVVLDERGMPDIPMLVLTLLLTIIGVIMVFSSSYARAYNETNTAGNAAFYFRKQVIFACAGIVAMFVVSLLSRKFFRIAALPLYIGAVALLLFVLIFGVGEESTGARRWINLGFTTMQPSELAKPAIVLMFASIIDRQKDRMGTFRYGVVPFVILLVPIIILLVLEPHLSATIIICAVGAVMMFQGGTRLRWFGLGLAVAALGILVFLHFRGYASDRIMAWRDPEAYADDEGYQIIQSLLAIGSGGWTGLGLGRGRQKYLYLPEEHNDYIFAVLCEELGFVGAMLVILLFVLLIIRGYWLAMHTQNRFASLTISGFTTLIALQVFFNIGVVTNLLPSTGISLPFFSYGGTALVVQLAEMGIVLAMSRMSTKKLL